MLRPLRLLVLILRLDESVITFGCNPLKNIKMKSISNRSERDKWINIKKNFQTYAVDEYWEQGFRLF
jgi:hypothetical protein